MIVVLASQSAVNVRKKILVGGKMTIKYQMRAYRITPGSQGFVYWVSDFSPDNDGSKWELGALLPTETTARNKADLINISINRFYPENLSAMFPPNSVIYTDSAGALKGANIPAPPVDYKVLMQKSGNIVFETINSDMVASGFDITSFEMTNPVSTPGNPPYLELEVGDKIDHPVFSASYNGTATSVTLSFDGTSYDLSSSPTNIKPGVVWTFSSNTEKEIILTASNGLATKSKKIEVKWFHKVYYGVGQDWDSIVDKLSFILSNPDIQGSLQKDVITSFTPVLPPDPGAYVYFICPQSYSTPVFSVGPGAPPGGFKIIGTINIGTLSIPYNVWRSDYQSFYPLEHNISI